MDIGHEEVVIKIKDPTEGWKLSYNTPVSYNRRKTSNPRTVRQTTDHETRHTRMSLTEDFLGTHPLRKRGKFGKYLRVFTDTAGLSKFSIPSKCST